MVDIVRSLCAILILASVPIWLASYLIPQASTSLATLMLIVGIVGLLWGIKRTREINKWELEREVTLAHLLDNPKLRIWAKDPPWSKALEDRLRADLTGVKARILASVELGKKESFEL